MTLCVHCQQPAQFLCGQCNKALYCSAECQSKNWKLVHQQICSHLKRKRDKLNPTPIESGLELLRMLIDNGVDDPVIHIARMLSVQDVQQMMELDESHFLRDTNNRRVQLFWYTRLLVEYPEFADRIGPFVSNREWITVIIM